MSNIATTNESTDIVTGVRVLIDGGELSPKAQKVIGRIAARGRQLAAEIQEMLPLASLSSQNGAGLSWVELDLAIACKVTQTHCIGVRVDSQIGLGTKSTLAFPSAVRTNAA